MRLSGCASNILFRKIPALVYIKPDCITFEGKGAGAAFALMATMGPVAAALGVAIDEGIAKDIRDTAEQGGCEL